MMLDFINCELRNNCIYELFIHYNGLNTFLHCLVHCFICLLLFFFIILNTLFIEDFIARTTICNLFMMDLFQF